MAESLTVPQPILPFVRDPFRRSRRKTRVVSVGSVAVGGNNPIRLQSMTTTDTLDTAKTVAQALRMVEDRKSVV